MSENKKLTINMPESLHIELKVIAARKKTTMRDLIVECIEQIVKAEKEETKK